MLLADDNADMRDYARRLLSQRWTRGGGQQRRDRRWPPRASTRPDVIVTDVMMPELDGFGLLRELRADAELQTIPVICCRREPAKRRASKGWRPRPTTIWSSPSRRATCSARVDAQILKSRARAIERRHAQRLTNLFAHAPVAIAVLRGPDHVYELANEHYSSWSADGR